MPAILEKSITVETINSKSGWHKNESASYSRAKYYSETINNKSGCHRNESASHSRTKYYSGNN